MLKHQQSGRSGSIENLQTLTERHPAMEEGRLVRLGRIADGKLKTKYEDYMTVDGIVRRRSAGLEARKCEIEEEIARLDARTEDARRTDARTEDARRTVELFTRLGHAEAEVARYKKSVNDAAAEGRLLKIAHGDLQSKVTGLEAELQERQKAFFRFLKRSEAAIQRDLDAARCDLEAYPDARAWAGHHGPEALGTAPYRQ